MSRADSAASGLSIQKLEKLASVTPSFPSPSSSFVPPPTDDASDFINKTRSIVVARRRDTSVSQHINAPSSPGTQDATVSPSTQGEFTTSPDTMIDPKSGLGEGKVAGRGRPISDPYGDKENHGIVDGLPAPEAIAHTSLNSPRSKHVSTPPSSMNGNSHQPHQHHHFLSMAFPTQDGNSPNGLSPPPPQTPSYLSMLPESKRNSLASSRPAPVSPTPSRHSSMLPSRRGSKRMSTARSASGPGLASVERPTAQRKHTSTVLMKIRDFAFNTEDERHSSIKQIRLRDRPRRSSNAKRTSSAAGSSYSQSDGPRRSGSGWSSFFQASAARFGFGSSYEGGSQSGSGTNSKRSSRLSGLVPQGKVQYDEPQEQDDTADLSQPPHSSSSQEEEYSDALPGASESEYEDQHQESDAPFVPGYYKALYPFVPEGTAEMALEEDQIVRCLGRGGGPGWIIAVKEPKGIASGSPDADAIEDLGHALVPEGYLEFQRAFELGEFDQQGGLTPRMSSSM